MTAKWPIRAGTILQAGLCWLIAAPAFGWGDKGHITVATLGERHLTQPAKRKVLQILTAQQRLTDPRTATWADHIRAMPSFHTVFPNNEEWHFIDTPLESAAIDEARDGKEGNNVIAKVRDFQKVLADPAQEKQHRFALLFIIHFVGDMHQPLHCVDRNDRGGNAIQIKVNGRHLRESNLHSFWDTALVAMAMKDLEIPDFAARLDANITVAQKKDWQQGTPLDWANESHQLAREKGYTLNGKTLPVNQVVDLDEAYINAARDVVVQQLQKAGIRLAKVLNDTFADN